MGGQRVEEVTSGRDTWVRGHEMGETWACGKVMGSYPGELERVKISLCPSVCWTLVSVLPSALGRWALWQGRGFLRT